MIGPVSFEDKLFPDEGNPRWANDDFLRWVDTFTTYFTSGSSDSVRYSSNPVVVGADLAAKATAARYAGGVLAPNGKIYAVGHLADDVLVINSYTDTFTSFSAGVGSDPSSTNGIYDSVTDRIYYGTKYGVYTINPNTDALEPSASNAFGTVQLGIVGQAYSSNELLVTHKDGNNYRIYDTTTKTFGSNIPKGAFTNTKGALAQNNVMFSGNLGGFTRRGFLFYDMNNGTSGSVFTPPTDSCRSAILAPNGFVYTFGAFTAPFNVVKINPITKTFTNVLSMNDTKSNSYCFGADGRIYGVGQSNQMFAYDWRTNTIQYYTLPANSFEGIVMGAKGDIYAIPWSTNRVAKLVATNNQNKLSVIQEFNGIIGRFGRNS